MNGISRTLLQFSLALIAIVTLAVTPAVAGPIGLSVQPANSIVNEGQSFDVDIVISDVVDLYAYQFDLSFSFNATVLEATAVTEGAFLPGGGSTFFMPGTIDNTAGTISFTAGTLTGPTLGVSGSGVLATISFNALAQE